MELVAHGRPTTAEEGVAFIEQAIFPDAFRMTDLAKRLVTCGN
jgi:hypothetical protein